MFKPQLLALTLILLPAGTVVSGCSAPKRAVGIQKVDSLVGRVERVHYDSELAIETSGDALLALRAIVRREFDGAAIDAFEAFMVALERSEEQARRLRADLIPMTDAAANVYQSWTEDIAAIQSDSVRRRSVERRDQQAAEYTGFVNTIEPALAGLEGFNRVLRDHALFLSNDLNASSIEILEPELETLRGHHMLLEDLLRTTMDAAQGYVRQSAPLGQVKVVRESEDDADTRR